MSSTARSPPSGRPPPATLLRVVHRREYHRPARQRSINRAWPASALYPTCGCRRVLMFRTADLANCQLARSCLAASPSVGAAVFVSSSLVGANAGQPAVRSMSAQRLEQNGECRFVLPQIGAGGAGACGRPAFMMPTFCYEFTHATPPPIQPAKATRILAASNA